MRKWSWAALPPVLRKVGLPVQGGFSDFDQKMDSQGRKVVVCDNGTGVSARALFHRRV